MISLRKSKMMALVGTMLVGTMLFAGCGGSQQSTGDKAKEASIEGKVSASGSTALLPLLKPAQEAFQNKNAKATVNIAGGGSFTGMNQVAEGSVQIGNSDVDLPAEYKDKGLVDHKVVVETFVFITTL